jgi:hypothetical protein
MEPDFPDTKFKVFSVLTHPLLIAASYSPFYASRSIHNAGRTAPLLAKTLLPP